MRPFPSPQLQRPSPHAEPGSGSLAGGAAIRPRTAGMCQRASRRRARQARVGPTPPPAGPPHPGAGPPRPEPTLPGSRGPVPATSSGHTVQCHCPPEARPASRSTPTSPRPVARLGPTRVSERSNVRLQSGEWGARQSQYNRDVDVAEWGGGSGGPGAVSGRTREHRGRPHCAQARQGMGGLEMGDGGSWEGPPSVLGAGWCSGLVYGVSEGPRLGPSPNPLEGSQSCSLGDWGPYWQGPHPLAGPPPTPGPPASSLPGLCLPRELHETPNALSLPPGPLMLQG